MFLLLILYHFEEIQSRIYRLSGLQKERHALRYPRIARGFRLTGLEEGSSGRDRVLWEKLRCFKAGHHREDIDIWDQTIWLLDRRFLAAAFELRFGRRKEGVRAGDPARTAWTATSRS